MTVCGKKNYTHSEIKSHLNGENYSDTNLSKHEDCKEENGIQFSDPLRREDFEKEEPNFEEKEDSNESEYLGAINLMEKHNAMLPWTHMSLFWPSFVPN